MAAHDETGKGPKLGGKDPSGYPEPQPRGPHDAQRGGKEKKHDPDDGGGLRRDPDGHDAPDE